MKLLIFLGVVSQFNWIYCKSACNDYKTCGECIGYALERCIWCAQDDMNINQPQRCQPQADSKYDKKWCPFEQIKGLDVYMPNVTEDKPFDATKGKEIQFRPQKIKLKLRPGVPVTFNISYQPAKDYPLDMYFLMDNSYTMVDHAQELANKTLKIYDALKKMTNNVRLGLGTYVEKPNLPYSDPRRHTTYAFKHHLSLTENMTQFKHMVNSYALDFGSNYDSPEAGFDALMQVMKCQDKIGWRSSTDQVQARRIIIVATDATYHSAGDGKMIGAFKPNDMECHLDEDGKYDKRTSQELDYPSVSQINYIAKENNIKIVFAVLSNVTEVYKALVMELFGAESVELKDDLIVQIIENAYITASRTLKLQMQKLSPSIKVHTDCDDDPEKCKLSQADPKVHINATVKAINCNKVPSFEINPFGILDKILIEVEIACECDCEKIIPAVKSEKCSSAGIYACGVCKCDTDRSGDTCNIECSDSEASERAEKCKEPPSDVICNGVGECVCGECKCNKTATQSYSGEYCQFDDQQCQASCPSDRGQCVLGKCICFDDKEWTGVNCNCPVSDNQCVGPFSKQPCSGRGTCKCGQCTCNSNKKTYFGNYCESCNDCAKELCEQLKDYANCIYTRETKLDCDTRFNKTSVDEVNIMNRTEIEAETSATGCKKKLDGNILVYKYRVTTNDKTGMAYLELMVQDELEEIPVANIWITIGAVIGGILLVGLLTLIIWKISTSIYDKREYDKFCQEATTAGFDVTNPVYLDPNVNFVNPVYSAN